MVGRFYQKNLQKGWVPPLRWRRRPHPRAVHARTTSPLNVRWATSIFGVGLLEHDRAVVATDHGERHFMPTGAHNPLEPHNSNVPPNSASGQTCDGRGHICWVFWRGSAQLTASARAVLRLQVHEQIGQVFKGPD